MLQSWRDVACCSFFFEPMLQDCFLNSCSKKAYHFIPRPQTSKPHRDGTQQTPFPQRRRRSGSCRAPTKQRTLRRWRRTSPLMPSLRPGARGPSARTFWSPRDHGRRSGRRAGTSEGSVGSEGSKVPKVEERKKPAFTFRMDETSRYLGYGDEGSHG